MQGLWESHRFLPKDPGWPCRECFLSGHHVVARPHTLPHHSLLMHAQNVFSTKRWELNGRSWPSYGLFGYPDLSVWQQNWREVCSLIRQINTLAEFHQQGDSEASNSHSRVLHGHRNLWPCDGFRTQLSQSECECIIHNGKKKKKCFKKSILHGTRIGIVCCHPYP